MLTAVLKLFAGPGTWRTDVEHKQYMKSKKLTRGNICFTIKYQHLTTKTNILFVNVVVCFYYKLIIDQFNAIV